MFTSARIFRNGSPAAASDRIRQRTILALGAADEARPAGSSPGRRAVRRSPRPAPRID